MNNISIAGQLGKDAETRSLQDGTPIASFSVADSQGREKPTIWWRCQLFGKRAEALAPYLTKGQAVTVTGNVTEREYEKDGAKVKAMEIRVNDLALQGGRKEGAAPAAPAPAPAQRPPAGRAPQSNAKGFDAGADDDIPW